MKSTFVQNVLVLITGTTVAQIIPIVFAPVLSRLYAPEDFGIFALCMAIVSFLSIISTGRYELAIMLPKREGDALSIAILSVLIVTVISITMFLLLWIFYEQIILYDGNLEISKWLYFILLMVFFMGTYQTLNYWTTRKKQYKTLAITSTIQKAVMVFTNLFIGINRQSSSGLIVGALSGQCVANSGLAWHVWKHDRKKIRSITWDSIKRNATIYKRFPIYSMPYSLIGIFSSRFIVFALSAIGFVQVAGFVDFSRSILNVPIALLSSAIGQVFFQEASFSMDTHRIEQIVMKLLIRITELFTPLFIFFVVWSSDIFKVAFGAKWSDAGVYAAALAPASFCLLFTSWLDRIYEISLRQNTALLLQICFDVICILLTVGLLYMGVTPVICVFVLSMVTFLYNAIWLRITFKIAGFSLDGLYGLFRKLLVLIAASFIVLYFLLMFPVPRIVTFIFGVIILISYYFYLFFKQIKAKFTT